MVRTHRPWCTALASAAALLMAVPLAAAEAGAPVVPLDDFPENGELARPPWRLVRFDEDIPPTRYRRVIEGGARTLRAHAVASMALLGRAVSGDVSATPVLCWRWRINAPLRTADLRRREGDDYAARVYVGVQLPRRALGLGTRLLLSLARARHGPEVPDAAVNYVWDNRYPIGTEAANAYTERAHMVVLESGAPKAGRWVQERRDVFADVARAFGAPPDRITLVALGSDTDNTGEEAMADFAGLALVAADAECPGISLD